MPVQINDPINANATASKPVDIGLVSYIVDLVRNNRDVRDRNHKDRWDQYERTYRGFYKESDKTRDSERSKLIAPALAQAIDATCALMEDAIFSRDHWFDTIDNLGDEEKGDVEQSRVHLTEDFDLARVPESIAKVILNGCIYGTGLGKINIVRQDVKKIVPGEGGQQVITDLRPLVTLDPIPPWEFVIDSQARDVDSALFCAHETHVPNNVVWTKQKQGIYRNVNTSGFNTSKVPFPAGIPSPEPARTHAEHDGAVWVTEYYGLAPANLVRPFVEVKPEDIKGNGMVEVIATVANESSLLRVMVNPFLMKDRPILAYQHDVVPGKFWGRGVAEKGWNAQRALDAELRARMDALGLLTSPMMGADVTRLPRNIDMQVRPGKVWLTRGRPSEVLEPIALGNIDPNTFNQSSEMERLVQVGTGAIESNAPLNTDRRNETASGISMIQSSALKRMRRTMWNLERQFLNPFVRKALWRLMQLNEPRYPKDFEFQVKGTMGVVAREFEQANLTSLLSVIDQESSAFNVVLQGIVELSGSPKREELLQELRKAAQPDPQQQAMQQRMQQIAIETAQTELDKVKAEVAEIDSERKLNEAKTVHELIKAELEDDLVEIQAANAVVGREKIKVAKEQNVVARERNSIEKIKARNKPNGSSR